MGSNTLTVSRKEIENFIRIRDDVSKFKAALVAYEVCTHEFENDYETVMNRIKEHDKQEREQRKRNPYNIDYKRQTKLEL